MKFKKIITLGILTSLISGFGTVLAEEAVVPYKYGSEYKAVELVAKYASELYIDENLKGDELIKDGLSKMLKENPDELIPFLKTMISTLDPYSEFFTLEEYNSYLSDVSKTFYGIGVIIQKNGDYIQIMGFTQDSPSEALGMKVGDFIAKVNGVDMSGKSLNEVRAAIMGELGTKVTITVLRDDEYYDFSVMRSLVKETTVECDKVDDNTAYISISDMAINTAKEFSDALTQVDEWGIKNIILDLRNNGGGYLDCAIELSKMIVPKGLIVKTVYRDDFGNKDYYSELPKSKYNFNVLVNEYTASAAEILASALQESGAGKLIGKETFGKAVIQQTYRLVNQSVLKLTVGRYITRNGNEINEVGITPDIKISNITNPIDTKKYTQFNYKQKNTVGINGDNVKAAKERLYLLGFYNGTIDDIFDDTLHNAVMQFQAKSELYPYGVLDITTQVKIENTFAKLEVLEDLQLEKAFELFGVKVEKE